MNIKQITPIAIAFITVFLNCHKASAIDMKEILDKLGNKLGTQLINQLLPSSETPTNNNPPVNPPQPINNYPMPNNYQMPNNYPSYPPTQYGPSSPPAYAFIYNPVIIVPQSPPIFNNYSNNMPR